MKARSQEFSIEKMATILEVSRCSYYVFLGRKSNKISLENQELVLEIKEVHKLSRGLYGSPRIYADLKKRGSSCFRKKVAIHMKQEKIQTKMRKKCKRTTQQSKKVVEIAPNQLDQRFLVNEPNKVWVSDITYVWTAEGWLYESIVLDLFSRKIVGLGMRNTLETELVTKALMQALCRRSIKTDSLIHHSDRGCRYTSKEFRELTQGHGILLSMSDKGHCYDNAVAESFFYTLNTGEVLLRHYRMREEARTAIFEYLEVFYNRERLHSTWGYRSPKDFEESWEKQLIKKNRF